MSEIWTLKPVKTQHSWKVEQQNPKRGEPGACNPLRSQALPCTWDTARAASAWIQPSHCLTTWALHSVYGLAFQLEWWKEKVLALDTHPMLKCVLFEMPWTKRKSAFLYCWCTLVFNSYYPSLDESSHAFENDQRKETACKTTNRKSPASSHVGVIYQHNSSYTLYYNYMLYLPNWKDEPYEIITKRFKLNSYWVSDVCGLVTLAAEWTLLKHRAQAAEQFISADLRKKLEWGLVSQPT